MTKFYTQFREVGVCLGGCGVCVQCFIYMVLSLMGEGEGKISEDDWWSLDYQTIH